MNTARLGGPALSGLTIAAFGVTACFALNAVRFIAVIVALVLMRLGRFFDVPRPTRGRVAAQIAEGLRYLRRTPEIAVLMFLAVTFGFTVSTMHLVSPGTDGQQPDIITGYEWWWRMQYPQASGKGKAHAPSVRLA
jgi:hypothetical protein